MGGRWGSGGGARWDGEIGEEKKGREREKWGEKKEGKMKWGEYVKIEEGEEGNGSRGRNFGTLGEVLKVGGRKGGREKKGREETG